MQAVVSNPQRMDLNVLDRDDEFRAWYGSAPDFHPRLRAFCSLDVNTVEMNNVRPLLIRIDGRPQIGPPPPPPKSGVPGTMARRFIAMYQQELSQLQIAMPPGPAARIAELQQKIEQLQQFLSTL